MLLSPPPRASLRPRGVVFLLLSLPLSAGPAHTDGRDREGGANVASHAHSPRAGGLGWRHCSTRRCLGDRQSALP
ncbi:hypothetical protein PBY51_017280 [Eleginops maclovinus]|uniref:MHC class I antigen n=1 Tax=Eleginops maclovinus TaxID=56733 RepID=A0AAN8AGG9_ELEMC|nr:hypothetical protein PBY51_017280 [Eleginops maclovinus]